MDTLQKLANRFSTKIAQAPMIEQKGATELFFGSPDKQEIFAKNVQDPKGELATYLTGVYSKTQKPVSFKLQIQAQPNQLAAWILDVNPPTIKVDVAKILNKEFRNVVGEDMNVRLKSVIEAVKRGSGSDQVLDVASLNLE